jgi:hypothetical protein
MNKSRLVFPKPNTNDVDTSFSSRQIHSDDEKNGILNIVKFAQNKEKKPRTKSSAAKPRTKSSRIS